MVSNREIVRFLKSKTPDAGFIDVLKIRYRPLICPLNVLLGFVSPGDKVFDVGCGSGQFALLINHFTAAGEINGVEISERLVRNADALFAAEAKTVKHSFSVYDGKVFPPALGEADVVFLVDVLHHVPPALQEAFITSIHQGMKPGAKFILKDINGSSPLVLFNKVHDLVFSGEIGKEMGWKKAVALAAKLDFKIERTFKQVTAVYPHYFLVLEKK